MTIKEKRFIILYFPIHFVKITSLFVLKKINSPTLELFCINRIFYKLWTFQMLDTFRELTFFAVFTMISVTKQYLVINLEWQEAEPSDRYKSCPSSKLHLHASLFFFFFFFFFFCSSLLLLSSRKVHIIFSREYTSTGSFINISIDIWSGKKIRCLSEIEPSIVILFFESFVRLWKH